MRAWGRHRRLVRMLALTAVAMAVMGIPAAHAGERVPIPDGYRMGEYRAPTPSRLPGAATIDTATAAEMRAAGEAVFLDVLPAPPRPPGREEDGDWKLPPHESIPGAHWLPNVGRGALSDRAETYYREHLARLTGGTKDTPLVIFCLRHCWMSWNAAKRALSYGYENVYWYPDGIDGWKEAGRQIAFLRPEGDGPP